MNSKLRTTRKTAIAIIALILSMFSCSRGHREIYVLPNGYTGRVVIIYDQANGAAKTYENGSRVYRIPESGVLKTQFSGNYEWSEFPDFHYGRIDKETQIPLQVEWENHSFDSVNATLVSTGSVYKIDDNTRIKFGEFYVGTKKQVEEATKQARQVDILEFVE